MADFPSSISGSGSTPEAALSSLILKTDSVNVVVLEPCGSSSSSSQSSPVEGSNALKAKRPSLSLPILRVEQLKEEGCSSPGSSAYNSEDSEFSDPDIINRLGEFAPPSEELALKIGEQVCFGSYSYLV